MRGVVHLEPLRRRDLVRADHRADVVVEHLGRGARKRAEARVAQPLEVVAEREAERRRALPDLEGRERVHVHVRHRALDRPHDRLVVLAGEGGMDAALETHLGRAALPRLDDAADDLVVRDEVRRPAEVGGELPLREGAEAAAEIADVRVLDVARDDVAHRVAAHLAAEPVGGGEDALPLLAARLEQARDRVLVELGTAVDGQRVARDERHLDRLAGSPRVLAREPERVGRAQRERQHLRVDPLGVEPFRVDGQARREVEAAAARRLAQPLDRGPRRLRVDVVDRHGRDAAPVVDARVEEDGEVLGEVRRRLEVDLRREQDPRGGERPEVVLEGRLRRGGHARAGLRAEVLDDHLLDVSVPEVRVGDRAQRVEPLLPRLADPDQDPRRERDALGAGGVERGEPRGRKLVRRAEVRAAATGEALRRRLEHRPHRHGERPQRAHVLPGQDARVQVRQQARLLEHGRGGAGEVLERRRAPELRQLLAGGAVPQLRLVAEREQRLAAAGGGSGAGDLQHLVEGQVRALAPLRRRRERAVVADVAAELRQRDEDLRRVRDEAAAAAVADGPRLGAQLVERGRQELARFHGVSLRR